MKFFSPQLQTHPVWSTNYFIPTPDPVFFVVVLIHPHFNFLPMLVLSIHPFELKKCI